MYWERLSGRTGRGPHVPFAGGPGPPLDEPLGRPRWCPSGSAGPMVEVGGVWGVWGLLEVGVVRARFLLGQLQRRKVLHPINQIPKAGAPAEWRQIGVQHGVGPVSPPALDCLLECPQ